MGQAPSVNAVADYFLTKINVEDGDSITNLKLQKLVYYAQAWHYTILGRPAFREEVQAWAKGPAVYTLWKRFQLAGWGALNPKDMKTDPMKALPDDTRELIDDVWDRYGEFQGHELQELTHSEAPWINARGTTPPGGSSTEEITLESMREFYSTLLVK